MSALFADHACGRVEEEAIRLQIPGAEVVLIVEVLHARRGLKIPRAHESAERRIKRKRAIAAALQRRRQAAIDAAGGNARHEISKTAERTRRQPRQHVVLGEPARPAIAFYQKIALLAVERLEMHAIAARHLDAWRHANVEARFVVDKDDVRRRRRVPAFTRNGLQAFGGDGIGPHQPTMVAISYPPSPAPASTPLPN